MRFGLIFEIIRSRFGLISLIFLVTLASAVGASLMMSKKYEAFSVLYVDVSLVDQVSGNTVYSAQTVRNKLSNEVEIIRSDAVVRRAIAILGYDKDPDIVAAWRADTGESVDLESWLSTGLLRPLDTEPSLDGTTITLSYEAGSGQKAASIVNAFAEAYMQASLELRTKPAKEYAKYFEEQTKSYRAEVDAAQTKLSEFQRESGIVATDERFDVENQRLQELSTRLVQAQADLSDAESRKNTARRRGMRSLPEIVQNPLIQSLKSELSRVEARMGQESAKFGKSHPAYKRTASELAQLRSRLGTEMRRVTRSLSSSAEVASRRVNDLQKATDEQREKVLGLKSQRDQIAILQRELQTAQEALVVTKRARETSMAATGNKSNVSVLTPAVAPLLPSRPNLVVNSAVGAILGLFLGFVAALTLEASSRPLRTSDDLLNAAGVPILAVLPRASSTKAQRLVGSTGPAVAPTGGALRITQ